MFTARVQYALILLRELKKNGQVGPMKLREVAESANLKLEFLEQVARRLRIDGFIKSVKGPGGGYLLAKSLEDVTLLDIHSCMQPDSKLKLATDSKEAKEYIQELYDEYLNLVYELDIQ